MCVKIFVLLMFPGRTVLHGHIMLMLCVLALQLFSAITHTTWFGYKTLYFTNCNAFIAPTMSIITFAQKHLTTDHY